MTDERIAAIRDILRESDAARSIEEAPWGDLHESVVYLLDALERERTIRREAVAAMRSAPRLQLAIWHAVHGPECSPESTMEYRLYETIRALVAVDEEAER